jgi:DNA replication protein DnaC
MPEKDRDVDMIPQALRRAIRECVKGDRRWPLFVRGAPGRGKTCAALLLLDHAGGFYVTASSLADWVNAAAFGRLEWSTLQLADNVGKPDPTRLWTVLAKTSLVVLDDIGTREKVSDAHYETIKRLLDEREKRPLMVLSNLSLDELAALYDDRIASRLASGTCLELAGEDRRLE